MALAILSMSAAAQEVAVKPFNVRYIDEDRLYQQYVVAQQYLQLQSQLKNDLQQAEKKKRTQIENFYNQVQTKYKNNQYKTQKAFEADQKKLEALQKKYEQQLNQEQMKLANEIDLFLADYAVKNDYDAILRKESAMFINPKWDVTDEVAEGLNARYNAANAPTGVAQPKEDGNATPAQP